LGAFRVGTLLFSARSAILFGPDVATALQQWSADRHHLGGNSGLIGAGTGLPPNIFLSLSNFDITRAVFTDTGNSFTLDNFTFTPVPGPVGGAGLPGLILACGVLLALARRRRQLVA